MRYILVLLLLISVGCESPFDRCRGLEGSEMQLCIAKAQAEHQAWQDFVNNMNAQSQRQSATPRAVVCTSTTTGAHTVTNCF